MADTTFITWPFFEPRHRELHRTALAWCAENARALDRHSGDLDTDCAQLAGLIGGAGWFKHCVPAAYGGAHETLDVRSICLMREMLGYHSGLADFMMAMQGLGSGAITLFGSHEMKSAYLPLVASGKLITGFALSEDEAGSDVASITTTATRTEGGFILNGQKTWISHGPIAGLFTVFARTGDGPGAKGLSAFVVPASTKGFRVVERIEVIAPHPLATIAFENCFVPESHLLGKTGEGFKIAMATLDVFRSTVGAAALGFARRAFDEAAGRATQRKLFGNPLADLQLMQGYLAEMALDIDASALLVYRAAWAKDSGQERVTREAAMAKLYATESAQQVIDKAVQMFGGRGVVSGVMVERLYREIRALRIYEGASEVQKVVIARQALQQRT